MKNIWKIKQNRRMAAMLTAAVLMIPVDSSVMYSMNILAAIQNAPDLSQEDRTEDSGSPAAIQEISISTPEEFVAFSQNCVSDSYSQGKIFTLEADINLQGVDYNPVPVFAGTFDGKGHTIIGLSIQKDGSALGLFRYVEEGAVVKNLTVHGTISPKGSSINIGGFAGVNSGYITNCTFSGEIMAQEAPGGIAGCNEESGVIEGCTNLGQITGNIKTGGIAGNNEGIIQDCVNQGDINATDQGVETESDDSLSMGGISLEETIHVEKVNDAGGITGYSLGKILNCSNLGTIGYPHTGYNIGGIAGRQSGIIEQCQNHGRIRGRKDVGGIVGQFEPYIEIDYGEDTLGQLEDELDQLSGMGDNLSRLLEQAGDTASVNLDQVDKGMDRVKDIGEFYKDVLKRENDGLNQDMDISIEQIQYHMDRISFDPVDRESQSQYRQAQEKIRLMKELSKELDQKYPGSPTDIGALKKWLQERYEKMSQMYQYATELAANLGYLAAHVPKHLVDETEDMGYHLEQVQMEASALTDILQVNRDFIRRDLENMDTEMTDELNLLSGNVDTLTGDLKNSRLQIRDQKNQMEAQIDRIRTTISDGLERSREDKELFADISDTDEEINEGTVFACENMGDILADYQSGGIVGIIGMEVSLDPEQDLEAEEEKTLNTVRNAKALVKGNINRGDVQVKNDYAGGIAGKANLGALIQNQNYGDILAEDGNYAGGITGSSDYVLRQNFSKCSVDGNNYAGGIAGWAKDMKENYVMVSIRNREHEWIGSVAGDVDPEGMVEGNFYVDEGMGAVDGITRGGQAAALSYEAFCSMEQVPEEFNRLTVEFLVEDQVLKTIDCEYGGAVAEADIPKAPQKDGYYYQWEEKDLSCIRGNEKVHAIYKAWNTTIASSGDKMPLMLAESNFYPGTTLAAVRDENVEAIKAQWAAEGIQIPQGYELSGRYGYNITQPEGVKDPETITVHVLAEEIPSGAAIAVVRDKRLELLDSRRDGSYLVFQMDGIDAFFILIPEKSALLRIAPVAAALILLIFAAVWLAGKKRHKKRAGEEEDGQEAESEAKGESEAEAEEGDRTEKTEDREPEEKEEADVYVE